MPLIIAFLAAALFFVPLAGGAWRIRGGVYPIGSTQLTRIIGASILALPIVLWTWNPWLFLLIPALWAGLATFGWGDFMDMTHSGPKSDELVSPLVRWLGPGTLKHDIAGMSLTATFMLAPAALLLWWCGYVWWFLPIAGLTFGPIYWGAWSYQPESGATENAEVFAGMAIGFALLLATSLPPA